MASKTGKFWRKWIVKKEKKVLIIHKKVRWWMGETRSNVPIQKVCRYLQVLTSDTQGIYGPLCPEEYHLYT